MAIVSIFNNVFWNYYFNYELRTRVFVCVCVCVCDKMSIPHTQPPHVQVPPAKNCYKLPSFNYRMRGHQYMHRVYVHVNGNSMV